LSQNHSSNEHAIPPVTTNSPCFSASFVPCIDGNTPGSPGGSLPTNVIVSPNRNRMIPLMPGMPKPGITKISRAMSTRPTMTASTSHHCA
jgi:hypothetical protein